MSEPPRPNLPSVLEHHHHHHQPPSSSSPNSANDLGFPKPPSSSGSGIKLPPISFLSNLSNLPSNSGSSLSSGIPRLLNSSHDHQPNAPPSFQSLLNNTDQSINRIPSSSGSIGSSVPLLTKLNDNSVNKLKEPVVFSSKPPSLTNLISSENSNNLGPSHGSPSNQLALPQVKLKEEITKPDIEEESDEAIIKYYEDKYGIDDFTDEEKHDILQHEKRARIEKSKNPSYKTYLCYSIIKRLNTVPKEKEKEVELPPKKEVVVERKKFVKRELTISNDDVLKYASKFPRKHLGSVLYTSQPTLETHKQLAIYKKKEDVGVDYSKRTPLLPELTEHINSIVTVRIPSYYITDLHNNPHYENRAIWGTDIYTDDSDVLLILKHCGWLPENNEPTVKTTPGNIKNKSNVVQTVSNFRQFINLIGGDIHVDLLILPKLEKYQGVYRNGINTRNWLSSHDGISVALYGVRYGEKGSSVDCVNNVELKKRKIDEISSEIVHEKQFKLNKDAWETAKTEIEELAKAKRTEIK